MANYIAKSRTNWFRVTDEEQFQKLCAELVGGEDAIEFCEEGDDEGLWHMFYCHDTISCYPKDVRFEEDVAIDPETGEEADTFPIDGWIEDLRKVLHPNDPFAYFEIGSEKMRYLVGYAFLATRETPVECIDIQNWVLERSREILGEGGSGRFCY